ncbi:unnamed protein product [Blepharisma stoltei]|uniref:Uncharacterized protein n=1 Tax=Blepharisma stoltei TaxID=1481888 RepID=A0AAU9JB45_9CILI|nr:unnamed protein product [Blepharisma stoltei]
MLNIETLKVCFRDEFYIISPVPLTLSELIESIKEQVQSVSSVPIIYYFDKDNDKIRLTTQKAYNFFLNSFKNQSAVKLYIEDPKKTTENIPLLPLKREIKEEYSSSSGTASKRKRNRDPSRKKRAPPSLKLPLYYDEKLMPSAKSSTEPVKEEPKTVLTSSAEIEANQFILDCKGKSKSPNWSNYVMPTAFLKVVSVSIFQTAQLYGTLAASISYRVPVELSIHFLYESRVYIESDKERLKFKKYVECFQPNRSSKFTPKFCNSIIQSLKSESSAEDHVLNTYNIDANTLNLWKKIFKKPKKPYFSSDPYPRNFRIQLVRDYLEGNYEDESVKIIWNVDREMIENWIYTELDEKDEPISMERKKRFNRADKEEIVEKYKQKKLSLTEIKQIYGVGQKDLNKWIKTTNNGFPLRDPYTSHKPSEELEKAYRLLEFAQ